MGRFSGERRALAAIVLAFYAFLFLLSALMNLGSPIFPMVAGLAAVYGLAFFSLVAGYFWARWFCIGVGVYGCVVTGMSMISLGIAPELLFFGITHLLISGMLAGRGPSQSYDGRDDWRTRWNMNDDAVNRLGKSVMRAGVMLPMFVVMGLAPSDGSTVSRLAMLAAAGVGAGGVIGLLRMRGWSLLALPGAAIAAGGLALASGSTLSLGTCTDGCVSAHGWLPAGTVPSVVVAGILMALATLVVTPLLRKRS